MSACHANHASDMMSNCTPIFFVSNFQVGLTGPAQAVALYCHTSWSPSVRHFMLLERSTQNSTEEAVTVEAFAELWEHYQTTCQIEWSSVSAAGDGVSLFMHRTFLSLIRRHLGVLRSAAGEGLWCGKCPSIVLFFEIACIIVTWIARSLWCYCWSIIILPDLFAIHILTK